ncbi:helix-turn-helix domain-containing protein [Kocuria palustris]|uniref:helix-turn-helix domain-containing protein n=2 Tax=Bacillati TaxID=1783272 RepID=UPI0039A0797B
MGKKIKKLREQANMSGRLLAEKTNLDPSQISKIEKGVSKPSIDALERICQVLNISLSEFFADASNGKSAEYQEFIETMNDLTPMQRKLLSEFIQTFKKE